MNFRVIYQHSHDARSPIHIIEQTTGWEVGWINRYLDREYVRRLARSSPRAFAEFFVLSAACSTGKTLLLTTTALERNGE